MSSLRKGNFCFPDCLVSFALKADSLIEQETRERSVPGSVIKLLSPSLTHALLYCACDAGNFQPSFTPPESSLPASTHGRNWGGTEGEKVLAPSSTALLCRHLLHYSASLWQQWIPCVTFPTLPEPTSGAQSPLQRSGSKFRTVSELLGFNNSKFFLSFCLQR